MNWFAQSRFQIQGIPETLTWDNVPADFSLDGGALRITAAGKTDLFLDPRHEYAASNSPRALFTPAQTYQLSSKAKVGFKADYDAAVLVLFAGPERWAKLCFEYSPQRRPTVVSVVNNTVSDDANHYSVDGNEVYLRIAGLGGNAFAFHYSMNGRTWNLVRYFRLDTQDQVRVGFSSQSPTGTSCESTFTEITYKPTKLLNLRDGS